MGVDAERAEQKPAAPAQRRNDAGLARTRALQPAAPNRGRDSEQHEEQRVHPAEAGDAPVAGGGEQFAEQRHVRAGCRLRTERARQRQPEHAEAVGHADAKMDAERRRRHQPAIEAGGRNGGSPESSPAVLPPLESWSVVGHLAPLCFCFVGAC